MEASELTLPLIVLGIITVMAVIGLANRVIAKVGIRNFYRHRGHSIISIIGLLVGTSIICASMVVGDSIEYFIVEDTYEQMGVIDVTVKVEGDLFFNETVYTQLAVDPDIQSNTDAIAPMVMAQSTLKDMQTGQFEPSVNIIGFDPVADREFGTYVTLDGAEFGGDDLGQTEAIINADLADSLDASIGDSLNLTYSVGYDMYGQALTLNRVLTVKYIAQDTGKALYNPGSGMSGETQNVYVALSTAQEMFAQPGNVNLIKISNIGDVEEGVTGSEELAALVQTKIDTLLGADNGLKVNTLKKDMLDSAKELNELVSTFLTIFGSFAIIAGVILIINIFTMLAEERKSELGMARAVGMKRRHLMQSFLFEGVTYGAVASAVGTGAGVGVGALLIFLVNNFVEFLNVQIPLHFQAFSLVQAFSMGFIITFFTILITSWRISKLNIIGAIRGIEEPKLKIRNWLYPLLSLMVLVLGIAAYLQLPDEPLVELLAPCAIITGIAGLLWRVIGSRAAVSVASLGVFIYCFYAIRTMFNDVETEDIDLLFIFSGILIVLSFVLLVMYNSGPIIKAITGSFGRVKKIRPTIMTAVSYPLTKKFRTGMSVAMFALVVYLIAMLSVFSNMFMVDVDQETLKQGGGFEIEGQTLLQVEDLANAQFYDPTYNVFIPITSEAMNNVTFIQLAVGVSTEVNVTDATNADVNVLGIEIPNMMGSMLFGIDDDFVSQIHYEFSSMSKNYSSEQEIWQAVNTPGSDKCVVSTLGSFIVGATVGNHIKFNVNPMTGEMSPEFEVIGIVDENLLTGVFMSKENLGQYFYITMQFSPIKSVFLFDLKDGYDAEATANALERDFWMFGMETTHIREVAETTVETMDSLFVLFEIYLDMGLVVGVAGLGVITIRSVVERTPEIGILRSIGFKRKNIMNAFLIEILFVATIGVILGMVSGLLVSHEIFNVIVTDYGQNIEFVIPWVKIATVTAIAYVATIICTIVPARNASRISPAEALRYVG